jgi:hypothetical protein
MQASYSNKLGDDPVVDVFPNELFVPPSGDPNLRRRYERVASSGGAWSGR